MNNDVENRTVILHFPRLGSSYSNPRLKDREMWLSMLEMLLESEFVDYKVTITEEKHASMTVEIEFSTVDDAMMFKLQH